MKRAFVTGGSGFVGGRVIRELRARGIEVRALARSDRAAQTVEALGATACAAISTMSPRCRPGWPAPTWSGARSVPRWLARATAALTSWMKKPPVTRTAIALIGGEVTLIDDKARRELGYTSHRSREQGLAQMRDDAGRAARPSAR